MTIQGSGWIYMSRSGEIKIIKNHQIKKDIALLIDWWEHAWALDYQSDKKSYLENIWRIINWDIVNTRL
jgi:Fe-Mn family superoxide dismutase